MEKWVRVVILYLRNVKQRGHYLGRAEVKFNRFDSGTGRIEQCTSGRARESHARSKLIGGLFRWGG